MVDVDQDLRTVSRVIKEAEYRLLAARKAQPVALPPIILAGAPCVWDAKQDAWLLHFSIHTSIREVWYGEGLYEVPAKDQRPFTIHLYIKLGAPDWSCHLGNVVTKKPLTLPHIDWGGACMEASDVPANLVTLADYKALEAILVRHCQGMQINSLYSSYHTWPEEIIESLPRELGEWLRNEDPDKSTSIRHLFKSNSGTEWQTQPQPPEEEEIESHEEYYEPEPPSDEVAEIDEYTCTCEACTAARAARESIRASTTQWIADQLGEPAIATPLPGEIWSF